ncbi:MAG TPA: phosphoribosyltransferase family protein [Candidatus Saccharimonadales bacterium]|nr:phosphoribosyltransferase family protein [Candidatus Saccharimonadales bacterium]
MTKSPNLQKTARQILNVIFPINCLMCGRESDWLCEGCLKKLTISRSITCCLCGKYSENAGLCQKCQKDTKLAGVIALFNYQDPAIGRLVKAAKYQKYPDALRFLLLNYRAQILKRLPAGDWQFTFVPSSPAHQKKRGFNQAEVIARALAGKEFSVFKTLEKSRETEPQVGLDRKDRLANLAGAFGATRKVGADVVICDDVITTGTTLKEAARTLRKAGVKRILAITIAHG